MGVDSSGNPSPASAAVPVTTPAIPQPTLASETPTSPTTVTTTITPPASGGPYPTYNVTLCPSNGVGSCVTATCADPTNCPVTGLQPGTTYTVTVRCWLAATALDEHLGGMMCLQRVCFLVWLAQRHLLCTHV